GGLLLTYPVHQAADILFCHGNLVPVGRDQLPHIEQTRVIARRFNERYAGGEEYFPEPDALLSEAPTILGLDGEHKMSKSRGNTVMLRMDADETLKKITEATPDADRRISYDPEGRPDVANLLTIASQAEGRSPEEIAEEIGDRGAGTLKLHTAEVLNEHLAPIRARRAELEQDPGYLFEVLRGATRRPSPRPRPLSRRSASSWGWSTDLLTGPGRAPRPSRSEAARAAGAGEAGGGESRGAGAR